MKLSEWQERMVDEKANNVLLASMDRGASSANAVRAADREYARLQRQRELEGMIQGVMRALRCDRGTARLTLRRRGVDLSVLTDR